MIGNLQSRAHVSRFTHHVSALIGTNPMTMVLTQDMKQNASAGLIRRDDMRNVAIIAHVDHG
ncbi:MAG: hypothetical protein KDD83_23235, partial [Caldilineaceae bacterium]|nr:hypothetical protein [Caldilineaceae bacterium]